MLDNAQCSIFLKLADEKVEELGKKSMACMMNLKGAHRICSILTKTVHRQTNEECDAYILGEIVMGISNETTKVQIYLDMGRDSYYEPRDYKRNISDMNALRKALAHDSEWRVLRMNYHLPSLHISLRGTNEMCEISVTNGLSVQLSSMIGHYFTVQPEAIKLYHFIRIWFKMNGVKLKTFSIVLLVIHYLQVQNFMPSAFRAQKNLEPAIIEDCNTSFDNTKTLSDYGVRKMHYYYSSLRGFFTYYANFKYHSHVISTYFGYAMRKPDHPKMDYDTPMCLPAFINQRSNTAHRFGSADLNRFVRICSASCDFLDEFY